MSMEKETTDRQLAREEKQVREEWQRRVPTTLLRPAMAGVLTVGIFIAGFGYWAARAPLAGAAIAPGVVVASGENQQVSHFEGGIIGKIAVREGERVQKNQPLIHLDPTIVQAERDRVRRSLISFTALLERAMAELRGETKLDYSVRLQHDAGAIDSLDILELQRAEFSSRLEQHVSELAVLDEQALAVEEEIEGIAQQIEAEKRKLVVLDEELAAKRSLLERGLTPKNQYNALLRTKADSQGTLGRLKATIAQRRKSISEMRERQVSIRATRRASASTQVNETRSQIADLQEQLTSRSDILGRMIIRAPTDGVVVEIGKNTVGSVVAPGETVLVILPTESELVIEARVSPRDIDVVQVGQEANVRFVALNTRTTPEITTTVDYVSADRLVDPVSREPYFEVRLRLDRELPSGIEWSQIFPGMPVDSFIKTGDRTFVEYVSKPVFDSFSRAFREE